MSTWGHVGHAAAWAGGVGAVVLVALAVARALGPGGVVRTLLASAVLACAQVVLAIEGLSLLGAIGLGPLLAFHAAALVAVLASGRRPGPLPLRAAIEGLRRVVRGVPLRLLAAAILVSALALLALVLRVPPNNQDGLAYHMTRVAVWLQQGSLEAHRSPDLRATILPANAELLVLWQVALLRHDWTAGLVQWLSWLGAMVAAFGVSREAGLSDRRAAFAALAFGALPVAVLQATTVQNDLTAAFFVAAALYFASRALEEGWPDALLAGAAFGLAIGTKPTAALALPAIALFLAARARAGSAVRSWSAVRRVAVAALAGTLLLGSYVYVQNVRRFGSPSGPAAFQVLMSPTQRVPADWWSNGGRLALQLVDPAGLAPPDTRAARVLQRGYDALADWWFRTLRIERRLPSDFAGIGWLRLGRLAPHEDLASFGLVYGALLALAAGWALFAPRIDLRLRALAAGVCFYAAIVAVVLRYQPFHTRLLLTAGVLGSPLLGLVFREGSGWPARVANLALVAASVASLFTCVLHNDRKPWLGPGAVWTDSDRVASMRLSRPALESTLRLLDRLPAGRLAVVPLQPDTAVYPFFGSHLDRPVTLVAAARMPAVAARFLPAAEYLLVGGKLQAFYVEGRPLESARPSVDSRDLRPLRSELRAGAGGWATLLSGAAYDEPLVLYVRGIDRAAAAPGLPAALEPHPAVYWDGWVPPRFRVPVLLDAERPTLVVSGTASPPMMPLRIEARLVSGLLLARFETDVAGPFTMRVPLGSAFTDAPHWYVPVTFTTDHGGPRHPSGADPRELAWWNPAFALASD